MALWGSSVRTRSSPVYFAELPGGVMVAQMILVHLVGVQIPAGELGFARNFCIFQPLSISSGLRERSLCGVLPNEACCAGISIKRAAFRFCLRRFGWLVQMRTSS